MSSTTTSDRVNVTTRRVSGFTGAEILGLPASTPITEAVAEQLRGALTEHAVIFLRDQGLEPSRHLEVARALGRPKDATKFLDNLSDQGYPEIGVIHDQGQGTARWHTDLAWSPAPVKYSILHMQQTPPFGGDTCWANQYVAFERLSPAIREFLLPLTACNAAPGNPDNYTHPLVISNPQSKRRALFFSPLFTTRIHELSQEESEAILAMLGHHSTKPEFICRWTYQVGDIAIWDNHYVMHYALNDYNETGRKIHRIEIEGYAPALLPAP
jgi:taurine dioxygenase